jgi:UDP-3-O-[3-hydroxymyristoyl] glucosamine N-acyltransferase
MDENIEIGEGSIICAGSILTTNIKIGKHTHLNLHTTVGHDTEIGDFFTTAPGVKISGNCKIGNKVYVGTNGSIKEKIHISENVTLGLNCGVVKHIEESGIFVGTPTQKIK